MGAEPGMCGRLSKSMYGARDGAKIWETECQNATAELGYKTGTSTACAFRHEEHDMLSVIHGDDVTVLADQGGVEWVSE